MDTIYDVMILGAGPAGLTAALYAGRSGLNTLLLEQGQDGGQIALTDEIENYPGQLEGESGAALIARMSAQAERFGAVRARDVIRSAELTGTVKTLTGLQNAYRAHAVILASGATPRPIGCKNEEQYVGRGISYCATCDAGFFRNKAVYVAGSNSIAVEEALYLTGFARKVTLLCGRERLSAPKALQERAFAQPKLHILWNTAVAEVGGSGSAVLDRMVLKDTESGAETVVQAERQDGFFGLFGFLGFQPSSRLFADVLDTDGGYLVTDEEMHTKLPGVFAAGDIRKKSLRQVVTAAADGAIAAVQAEKYLRKSGLI